MDDEDLEQLYPSLTFMFFSLNPMATVVPLRDDEAITAAKDIVGKRYFGMLTQAIYISHLRGELFTSLELHVVSRKYPKPLPLPEMNANSFIPIFPASHPMGRKPIHPNSALPWENCMFHCRPGISLFPASVDRENATFVAITEDDADYLEDAISDELDDRRNQYTAALESGKAQLSPTRERTDSFTEDFLTNYKQDMNSDGYESGDDNEREISISPEERLLLERLEYLRICVPPAMDLSYNMSTSPDIGDLDDLLQEIEQLVRIAHDSETRAKLRLQEIAKGKVQNLAWVKDANAALDVDDDTPSIDETMTQEDNVAHDATNILKNRGFLQWRLRKPYFIPSPSSFKATLYSKISSLCFGCFGSNAALSEKTAN